MKKIFYPPGRNRLRSSRYYPPLPGHAGFRGLALILVLGIAGLAGCVSDIGFQTPDAEPAYVVEGWIEQDNFPRVMVSQTLPYNSEAGLADLIGQLVTDARVSVICGSEKENLSLVKDTMYTVLPVYRGFRMRGEVGKIYTLEVWIGDRLFTSTDTLNQPVKTDSVWFIPESAYENHGFLHVGLSDPPEPGHCYRILYKRLGKDLDFNSKVGNVLDDRLFNGQPLDIIIIRSGFDISTPEEALFQGGQTVVIKTCRVSVRYFEFLSSVSSEIGVSISPLNTQTRSISLMSGGALGGWGCYGVSLDTITIPERIW